MKTYRLAEEDIIECGVCYDCKWVLNDPLNMPFSALVLDLLQPGDEIIRCWECNQVSELNCCTEKKKKKPRTRVN